MADSSVFAGCVVTYDHKHGNDSWVTLTRESARKSIYSTILEWIDDLDDDALIRKVLAAIKADDYPAVCDLWADSQEEFFCIRDVTVSSGDEASVDAEFRDLLASVEKRLEEDV